MREKLYRAKTTKKKSGEFNRIWVGGDLIKSGNKYYIHPHGNVVSVSNELGSIIVMHEVYPETICQYTGVPDKNGRKIFEGDICRREILGGTIIIGQVVWVEYGMCGFKLKNGNDYYPIGKFEHTGRNDDEVIGNIFDNPELVESEAVQ